MKMKKFVCERCGKDDFKNGRAMGGHKGRCRGIPYYPKNQTAGKDLVTTAINNGSSGIPLYVCDRCGKNDFPNGHALGGHKRYCGKPQYYSSVTKDNNNAGLQPQKKRKIIRKRKVTSKSKKGTNTSNTTISKRTHVLFQGRSNSNNNASSRATNRKKTKKTIQLSPYDHYYEEVRNTMKECGNDVIDFIKVRGTKTKIYNGIWENDNDDPLTGKNNHIRYTRNNIIGNNNDNNNDDGADNNNNYNNNTKNNELENFDDNNEMEILRRLRKVVHKDTVTAFQMSHVRLIFITTRRNQLIEKMRRVVLGDQVNDNTIMFDSNFTWDIIASYDLFQHNFRHANDWSYKFDLIFAFTAIINMYDSWKHDPEFGWRNENNFLKSLGKKWQKVLTKSKETLGIHEKDIYTHDGILIFLEEFQMSLDQIYTDTTMITVREKHFRENMKFHYLASHKKTVTKKRKQRRKDDNESSGEELSSYEGYDEYMPFTEDDANIFRFHKENNNGHHIKNMTGCIPETIPGSFIGQTPRVKDKSINESELLKEKIKEELMEDFLHLITTLPATHPKILRINMLIQQFNLTEYVKKALIEKKEKELEEERMKGRRALPPKKKILNRRITLADQEGAMFPGKVISVRKGTSKEGVKHVTLVRVLYDDGETDTDLDLAIEEFEWLEDTPNASAAEDKVDGDDEDSEEESESESEEGSEESEEEGKSSDEEESDKEESDEEEDRQSKGGHFSDLDDDDDDVYDDDDDDDDDYDDTGVLDPQKQLKKDLRHVKLKRDIVGCLYMRRNNKHINKQRGTWVDINGFTTAQLGHWLRLMKAPNPGNKSKRRKKLMPYLTEKDKWQTLIRTYDELMKKKT